MNAAEAELDRNEVVCICLRYTVAAGGNATTAELYAAVAVGHLAGIGSRRGGARRTSTPPWRAKALRSATADH